MTMKYTELKIQTQREVPNNARTEGFAFLVRAGYLTRENELLPLGELAVARLKNLSTNPSFFSLLSLPLLTNDHEIYFPLSTFHWKYRNHPLRILQIYRTPRTGAIQKDSHSP